MSSIALDHRPTTRAVALRIDVVLLVSTLVLGVLGVVMVYSATRSKLALAGLNPHYYLDRQAEFVALGTVVMLVLAVVDYRWLEHVSALFYVGIVLALLAMFAVGHSQLGATRWISVGPLQLQPSAFATLVEIVVVATFCARRPDGLAPREVVRVLVVMAIPIALVVKQPDLGSGMIMAVVLFVLLVVAGIPTRYLILLVVLALLGVLGMAHFHLLKQYQVERFTSFLNQSKGSRTNTYNVQQSKAAIATGGFWGSGLFQGRQTNLAYVPEQQTDFIFSAVGEQLGFVGSASVVLLLGVVCWRVLRAAQLARDPFGRLLATGAFALLAFSAFENAGMTMGIMPIAGIPLPFLSYGGSAVIAFFAAVGMSLSVALHRGRRGVPPP